MHSRQKIPIKISNICQLYISLEIFFALTNICRSKELCKTNVHRRQLVKPQLRMFHKERQFTSYSCKEMASNSVIFIFIDVSYTEVSFIKTITNPLSPFNEIWLYNKQLSSLIHTQVKSSVCLLCTLFQSSQTKSFSFKF